MDASVNNNQQHPSAKSTTNQHHHMTATRPIAEDTDRSKHSLLTMGYQQLLMASNGDPTPCKSLVLA
jgi:hypothetical protein